MKIKDRKKNARLDLFDCYEDICFKDKDGKTVGFVDDNGDYFCMK